MVLTKKRTEMELLKKEPVKGGGCYVAPSVDIIDVFAENTFCSTGSFNNDADSDVPDDFIWGGNL